MVLNVREVFDRQLSLRTDTIQDTKQAFGELGYYQSRFPEDGVTPFADEEMHSAVTSFQRKKGLQVDGRMRPDGPTQHRVNGELYKRRRGQNRQRAENLGLRGSVGRNGRNAPEDVKRTKRALSAIELYPKEDKQALNSGKPDRDMQFGLDILARKYGIGVKDGRLDSNSASERELHALAAGNDKSFGDFGHDPDRAKQKKKGIKIGTPNIVDNKKKKPLLEEFVDGLLGIEDEEDNGNKNSDPLHGHGKNSGRYDKTIKRLEKIAEKFGELEETKNASDDEKQVAEQAALQEVLMQHAGDLIGNIAGALGKPSADGEGEASQGTATRGGGDETATATEQGGRGGGGGEGRRDGMDIPAGVQQSAERNSQGGSDNDAESGSIFSLLFPSAQAGELQDGTQLPKANDTTTTPPHPRRTG